MKNIFHRFVGILAAFSLCMMPLGFVSSVEAASPAKTDSSPGTLRVLTYNIQIGIGMDKKIDLERTAEVIRRAKPDLVALQEVDRLTDRSQGVDQAQVLAEKLGMHYVFGYASSRAGGDYGVVILSRWPILETSNHPLPHVGNRETRTILSALIEIPGHGKIQFLSAHLQNALANQEERLLQIGHINQLFGEGEIPAIFGTDLNAYPDTPEVERMKTNWIDATSDATENTYPADEPKIRLDYIFVRAGDPWQVEKAEVLEEPLASDHRPVLAVLVPGWSVERTTKKAHLDTKDPDSLQVMSYNIWVGGEAGGQPLEQTAEVIRRAGADVIGLQETNGYQKAGKRPNHTQRLAESLGFHYAEQASGCGILSRYPIVTQTPLRHGVEIELPSGKQIWMFNVHFAHAPYQPYQLVGIPYANGGFLDTAEEAVQAAVAARGHQVAALLSEMEPLLQAGASVFLTGDFNEPSHLDWTPAAVDAGDCPLPVVWPTTRAVTDAGLKDSYRTSHPDEVTSRGLTWTPTTKEEDPKDRHDRIDFLFFSGNGVEVQNSSVVGEKKERADIVVSPYPSDHRAVLSRFRMEE